MIAVPRTSTAPPVVRSPPTRPSDLPRIPTLVGGLGSGSTEMDALRRHRLRAERRAAEETTALLRVLHSESNFESAQSRDVVLAQALFWLPHVSGEWAAMWAGRREADDDSVLRAVMSLLTAEPIGRGPEGRSSTALASLIEVQEWETWDPVISAFVLQALLRASGPGRAPADLLPESCLMRMERAVARMESLLLSGDYRRRGGISDSPQLLLCVGAELWRRHVVHAARLRAPLEEAIRWELQVDAADTVLARSAMIVAAENLHLRGVDLRAHRRVLMDELDNPSRIAGTTGRPRPGILRHPDGRIFSAGPLIAQILMIRALVGQPRSSCGSALFVD